MASEGPAVPCNLLVTCDTHHREAARLHVEAVLAQLGSRPRQVEGAPPGLLEFWVQGDPRAAVRHARQLCREDPRRFAHTHHWRPVDAWTGSDLDALVLAVGRLAPRIGPRDTWRLTVDIHGPSGWRSAELVKVLTQVVQQGIVQLHAPDKELRVDVLGGLAALAVLARGDELAVHAEREAALKEPQDA